MGIGVWIPDHLDEGVRKAIARARSRIGFDLLPDFSSADVVIVDLDQEMQKAWLSEIRSANRFGKVLAVTRSLDGSAWVSAERSGADKVVNVGRLALALQDLVTELRDSGGATGRRIAVCASADVAGRLGFLLEVEVDGTKLGLFRVSGGIQCVQLLCPHQGESLAEGEIERECIVTCPRHGSQFDLTTGERIRGPADEGLKTYRVVEDLGRLYVVL
jgi:nitrite reductase/ring-hydroxylating ferredoxin subunit